MAIKLKTKIALGGIFLFALLILVGAVSSVYFNRITEESRDIVKNNYETLNYSREMIEELNDLADTAKGIHNFEQVLQQQEKNITEPGEREMTISLRKNFNMSSIKPNFSRQHSGFYFNHTVIIYFYIYILLIFIVY